jgi:WD40 repeat protein
VYKDLIGHKDVINGLCFHSSNYLVSGSADRMIKVWDLNTGKTQESTFSKSIVTSIDASLTSKTIASGHQDGKLRVWSISPSANQMSGG